MDDKRRRQENRLDLICDGVKPSSGTASDHRRPSVIPTNDPWRRKVDKHMDETNSRLDSIDKKLDRLIESKR